MENKRITISMRIDVLQGLDAAANNAYLTRSGYIHEAIVLKQMIDKMRAEPNGRHLVEEFMLLLSHQGQAKIMRSAKLLTWAELQD